MSSQSAGTIKLHFRKACRISAAGSAIIGLCGSLQTSDKAFCVEWLGQIANCPGRKRLGSDLLIRECREENKRNAVALSAQVILQLDAAHARHLDICNDAREIVLTVRSQEVLGGRERMYDISERPYQAAGGGTYGFVVVNDCNKRWL